jgi:hypothetical protein
MITDWMGNEIKEGMEVCFITTKYKSPFLSGGYLNPATKEYVQTVKFNTEVEDVWLVGGYFKVYKDERGRLVVDIDLGNGFTYVKPLDLSDDFGKEYEGRLLGIKGISDKQKDNV